ncbi:MAG: HIT domain-containing protein [Chloroflexi bacterium]|nr:MAG: HIT domain-containing protein [Chloroflexota bacterium]
MGLRRVRTAARQGWRAVPPGSPRTVWPLRPELRFGLYSKARWTVPSGKGCAFCAVVSGAEHHAIYRDDATVAFLDHAPVAHGHTLVVPTTHYETLEDMPDAALAPLFAVVKRVSKAFATALGAEGSLTLANTRISQSVAHVHVHVVPRRKGDRFFTPGRPFWMRQRYAAGEAEAITSKLREALAKG